mgnify:CR=1 FL=1
MQNINTKYIIPKELEKMFDIDLNTMNQISKKFNLILCLRIKCSILYSY